MDAAAQSDEHAREAAFADVIAGTEDQGLVHGLVFVRQVRVQIALARDGVDEDEIFGERSGGSNDVAASVHGEAAAVEHQRVIPSDLDRKSTRLNSSHLGISYAVF